MKIAQNAEFIYEELEKWDFLHGEILRHAQIGKPTKQGFTKLFKNLFCD